MRILLFMAIGAAVAAGLGYWMNRKKKAQAERNRQKRDLVQGANVTNDVTRVGLGGVLKLPAFGANPLGIETYVKAKHRYDDGGAPWYEFECEFSGRKLLLEWERDGAEIYLTAGFDDENPKLEQLGITEEDLIRFDEDEKGSFEWDGAEWHYDDSSERRYYANDGQQSQGFYGWDFESEDETRYISVEKWEGDRKFYVYHGWALDAEKVEVFDAGGRS
ncbi:MAG: DUF4178 domain-containing protein [Myxococcota bacterium]|nr:DUF4178 domain-containing protein [Myxococcota bacterium]